jgi:hypothetical protein
MNKIVMMLGILSVVLGCRTIGVGEPVIDAPVIVADGYTLERAVLSAATRRQWSAVKTAENVYRLTIRQRSNICCVDVVMKKDCLSILPVESNISVAKYNQWVNNLEREIRYRASTAR